MRKILSLFVAMLFLPGSKAQILHTPITSLQFSENINKVVCDFKNNFYNIQGDQLPGEPQMDVFKSNVSVPGAIHTYVFRFHSKKDNSPAWQAIMFQGESYSEAMKSYKNTSRLLNKLRVTLPGSSPVGFSGKLNDPDPNITFAGSSFKLNSEDPAYVKFYAEIEILNTGFDSWEVRLNLHNKKEHTEKE